MPVGHAAHAFLTLRRHFGNAGQRRAIAARQISDEDFAMLAAEP